MKETFSTDDERVGAEGAITPDHPVERTALADTDKSKWERLWPVIACGAGLFSDGYLNGVIGSVSTMLSRLYKTTYAHSPAQTNVSSITFAGTVVGMLIFGWTSDHWSRKWSLFISTIIVLVFAALGAGSYGAGGSAGGLFAALTAYRFFLGIGIGGEYPAGSVACAEATGEMKEGTRNRWFVLFTNNLIDFGFVVAAIVPMIVVLITGENHLRVAWRICLGLGVVPPLSLLWLRFKLTEPEAYKRESMANTKTPWKLVIKFYWFRLAIVSVSFTKVIKDDQTNPVSAHLVHLRLQQLLLWHLLFVDCGQPHGQQYSSVEELWLEHVDQLLLSTRLHIWRVHLRLDRAQKDSGVWRHRSGNRRLHLGWLLLLP